MLVSCILLPHFPLQVEMQRNSQLKKKTVLVVGSNGSQRIVLDYTPRLKGISNGMPLQTALATARNVDLVEADMPRYHKASQEILHRLLDISPDIEDAGLGRAYVKLDGLLRIYKSEERLLCKLADMVPKHYVVRIGVAIGKFPAYLASLKAKNGIVFKPQMSTEAFVSSFPVETLPIPWQTIVKLHSFGLNLLADIARLDLGPLQAQFGPSGRMIWLLAKGEDRSPLQVINQRKQFTSTLSFAVPLVSLEILLLATEILLNRLFDAPDFRNKYAREIILKGSVFGTAPWQQKILFKTPIGNVKDALRVIRNAIDSIKLPGPLEDLSVTLQEVTGEVGQQESLFHDVKQRENLAQTVNHMKVAFGKNPLFQVREVEPWSRVPERRNALVPFDP